MRFLLSILISVLFTTGCATHFYRIRPDAVAFYLRAPSAEKVQIVASFNHFTPQAARRRANGVWVASMPADISFRYFYLVDGHYYLPPCTLKEQDDFGQANCIFVPTE